MSNWIILRCSGRTTMRLAETLTEDGYEAWTPVETRMMRIPSANVRRPVRLPIMPSYVFARAHNLIDLIQLAGMSVKPRRQLNQPAHADFSVMRCNERFPVIADHHLQGLRTIEAKRTPKKKAIPLPPGMTVKVKQEGGSYAGMKGKVERSKEGWTLVCIDNRLTVKISTSLLEQEMLLDCSSVAMKKAA